MWSLSLCLRVAVTEMGIILGHDDGRIEVLSESGIEFAGTASASIDEIVCGGIVQRYSIAMERLGGWMRRKRPCHRRIR